jgi:PKD repeat protein
MMRGYALRHWIKKGFFVLLIVSCFSVNQAYASVTLAWDKTVTNQDGSPCMDLAGYMIYYDSDQSGAPYNGSGLDQGASPIVVPVSLLSDPNNPDFVLSGLTPGITYQVAITAFDSGSNESGYSNEILAAETAPADTIAPAITINSPTSSSSYSTISSMINLAGTASDDTGVTAVTWSSTQGGSGTASGTTNWSTGGISLSPGQNVITVTATDAAGNVASDTLTVTYTAPDTTTPTVSITSPTSGPAYTTSSDTVSLAGNASDDIGVTSVTWVNDEGASGTATGTTNWSVSGVPLVLGDNTITVTATDSAGNSGSDIIVVTMSLPPDTTAPTVGITSPTSGSTYTSTASTISLAGIASDDTGVTAVTWSSTQGGSGTAAGESNWSISNVSLAQGSNMITVTAHDAAGNTGTDMITISYSAPNNQPTANAGPDRTVTQAQLASGSVQVTLDGSLSSDPEGDALSYQWTQTQGNPVNLMGDTTGTPFFSATSALSGQTLVFQLLVNDGKVSSAPDSVQVTIEANVSTENEPPTAHIAAQPTEGIAPLSVTLGGSGTDADGTVAGYAWNFGDGVSASVQNTSHTYTVPGTYTVTLTVTDDGGATDTATEQILVTEPPAANQPPSVSISATPSTGTAPLNVNFSASTADSDGTVTGYHCDFGDGTSSQSKSTSHVYNAPGEYVVTVTATDDAGDQATDTVTISVTQTPPDQDTDQDGITDVAELAYGLNTQSADSDGDGIPDLTEWGPIAVPVDTDQDGTLDALDMDSDNDGKPDSLEGIGDADGDGAADYVDLNDGDGPLGDQDQDGVNNSTEVTYMMNPNAVDSDQDSVNDGTEFGPLPWPLDSDGDETIDAQRRT